MNTGGKSLAPVFAGLAAALAFMLGAAGFGLGEAAHEAMDQESGANSIKSFENRIRERVVNAAPAPAAAPSPAQRNTDAVTAPARIEGVPIAPSGPMLAIVIDDLGVDAARSERTLALPVPLTAAFLPYGAATSALAQDAAARGHEVILHMPMQPQGEADPGPGALLAGQGPQEMQARLAAALERVPGAVGLNNHMGSLVTRDAGAMRAALAPAAMQGLYFLDSVTTPGSRAAAAAEGLGMAALRRDVFIDHADDPAAIRAALDAAERLARERGFAVAIGHPREATLSVLEDWLPGAQARGLRFVAVSEVIAARRAATVRTAALGE
ncbi:MAG: divergent polysaccharide deacetylase family protein [Maricaulaceae bacterium]|nr:divergent polysaccharide deacetylase family protein [Maricaulaceae bacterium]